ncbi:hypothetical protein H6P81_020941 [Aristolochia fimbriata]|uniref:TF-B3 domain-containing protein n=1 Tax=Aristolochia fimbriata TaxID=158543 RepID=A0AAV7DYV8_ARIFI|nr:hypothetical protein H6P81_020941 [Aristolochia fimbriata]
MSTSTSDNMWETTVGLEFQMGGKCEECEWRERFYWNRMESWRFLVALPNDFSQRLKLPKEFAKHVGKRLPHSVLLTGPALMAFPVSVTAKYGEVFFGNGWDKFAERNCLAEGDTLLFNCKGVSNFDVMVFDKSTGCEKLASLFAGNCGCARNHNSPHEAVSVQPNCSTGDTEQRTAFVPAKTSQRMTDEYLLKRYHLFYWSSRRVVTEDEKARPVQLAHAATPPNPSFVVAMVPTHVTYKFIMTIPTAFVRSHLRRLPPSTFTLSIHGSPKEWIVSYVKGIACALGGTGWMKFVWDNNLEENDALLFELDLQRRNFVVQIFRVVEQTVPLIWVGKEPKFGLHGSRFSSIADKKRKTRAGSSSIPVNPEEFEEDEEEGEEEEETEAEEEEEEETEAEEEEVEDEEEEVEEEEEEAEEEDNTVEDNEAPANDRCSPYPFIIKSGRRPVTEEEEERAIMAARSVQPANPYFLLIMRKSHVSKRYYLTIPSPFVKANPAIFMETSQPVFLRTSSGRTHLVFSARRRGNYQRVFDKGWSDFVLKNNLEQGDMLVFEHCNTEAKTTFDVRLFRVVEDRVVEDAVPSKKTCKNQITNKRPKINVTQAEMPGRKTNGSTSGPIPEVIVPKCEDESSL